MVTANLAEPTLGDKLHKWLECELQRVNLGRELTIRVRVPGHSGHFLVPSARILYLHGTLQAERDWDVDRKAEGQSLPADCYQTGTGWIRCWCVSKKPGRYRVIVPRESELALVLDLPCELLFDDEVIRERTAA